MILNAVNLTQYLPKFGKTKHNVSGGNTTSSVQMYLNQLPSDLLQDLHDMYKIDFDLFGYSMG